MRTFHFFRIGLISMIFVCGGIGLILSPPSQAELFKKKGSFAAAPLVQKIFEKTVCGFQEPGSRFVTSKDGEKVCDRTSGYIWEQDPNSGQGEGERPRMTFSDAIEFCANLGNRHGNNYMLPTVQQLVSVLDYTQNGPAVTEGVFDGLLSDRYWTSTPFAGVGSARAYAVQLAGGQVPLQLLVQNDEDTSAFVWCVKGGKKKKIKR